MTQPEAARLLGVARATVGGWEKRGLSAAPALLSRIAEFLGYAPEGATQPADLARNLAALRRKLRLSRRVVAGRLGVSVWTLCAWESGYRRPRGRSIARIREFMREHSGTTSVA